MKVTELKENQIYRNSRNHLIILDNNYVCYIDIPHEAVVYTTLEHVRTDDWELYIPAVTNAEVLTTEEFETAMKTIEPEATDEVYPTKDELKQAKREQHSKSYGRNR